MKKILDYRIILTLIALLISDNVFGQTTPAGSGYKIQWDQALCNSTLTTNCSPDLASTQSLTFNAYIDGMVVPAVLQNVTCTQGTNVIICTAPLPVLSTGIHAIALTAQNQAGETPKSMAIAFNIVIIPATPSAIRIIP